MSDERSNDNNNTDKSSSNESDDNKQAKSRRAKKNFIVICLTFILIYTPYNAVTNLQSSINIDKNIGLYSLAVISVCSVVSCLFLTHPFISIFGYKWSIFISQVGFLLFIVANIYPKASFMFPASVLCGLLRAGFWTSQSAFITDISTHQKTDEHEDKKAIVNKYFGIFFSTFQTTQIWGNLVSYLILAQTGNNNYERNETICGAAFTENT
ncbi:unnamed protein product, partial [Didymodactylos carnosus]